MAYPRTAAEIHALTITNIRPIYDAMQISYPSLLPERPSSGKGNYLAPHLKQALLQAIVSPAYSPTTAGQTTNSLTNIGTNVPETPTIPNSETLTALLKQQDEELAEQQRLAKEVEQRDLYQEYLKNDLQLKAGRELIKKRQEEQARQATLQMEIPATNSAQPPSWVNALNLKIDNFLKKSAVQVSDDEAEEPIKNLKGKKKPAPVLDDEDEERTKKKRKSTTSPGTKPLRSTKTHDSDESSDEDVPDTVTTPRRRKSLGDDHCSPDKDQRVIFATQSALSEAINQQLEAETGSATISGYLCQDPAFIREALFITSTLKSMKKYLPIVDRGIRTRTGDPPVDQVINPIDHQRASAAMRNFVYEILGTIYKSRGTRVSAVRLGPQHRGTLDAAEKLLTPVQAIDEENMMEKLYGELDSDRTKKNSKALLQAGRQPTAQINAPTITPITGPPRCQVCLKDHYNHNANCNLRCKKCKGAIPFLKNHPGLCN